MSTIAQGPEEVVTEALMQRQAGGHLLVVEGKTDDLCLRNFIDSSKCVLVAANGREAARAILDMIERERLAHPELASVRVLLDRDDDEGPSIDGLLLRTIGRDLDAEVASVGSNLIRVVTQLHELREEASVRTVVRIVGRRAHLMRSIRTVSARLDLGIPAGRAMKEITAIESLAEPIDQLASLLGRNHEKLDAGAEALAEELKKPILIEMCQGHDLHRLIAKGSNFDARVVQKMLVMALELRSLQQLPTPMLLTGWAEEVGLDLWLEAA